MTVLLYDSVMDNPDLAEMLGPGRQQIAVRNCKGQMVQNFVGRSARLIARTSTLCEHDHDFCVAVSQRYVAEVGIFGKGAKSKDGAIPPSTCAHIRDHELHMRKAGDRCDVSGLQE